MITAVLGNPSRMAKPDLMIDAAKSRASEHNIILETVCLKMIGLRKNNSDFRCYLDDLRSWTTRIISTMPTLKCDKNWEKTKEDSI